MSDRKATLKGIADNKELFEAVKATVLEQFAEVPYAEGASDELLGQITRARLVGRKKVEDAFRGIEVLRSIKPPTDKENPAY